MVDIPPHKRDKYTAEWRDMDRDDHQRYGNLENYIISRAIEERKIEPADVKSRSEQGFKQAYSEVASQGEVTTPIVEKGKIVGRAVSPFFGSYTREILDQAPKSVSMPVYSDTGIIVKPDNMSQEQYNNLLKQQAISRREYTTGQFTKDRAERQLDIFSGGMVLTQRGTTVNIPTKAQRDKTFREQHPFLHRWGEAQKRTSGFIKRKTPDYPKSIVAVADRKYTPPPKFLSDSQFKKAGVKKPFGYRTGEATFRMFGKKGHKVTTETAKATLGVSKGIYDYPREKPLNVMGYTAGGLVAPYVFTGANVLTKGAFIKTAPYIHPTVRTGMIAGGKVADLGVKGAVAFYYGKKKGQEIKQAPNTFRKGEVVGGTVVEVGSFTAGSYATHRTQTYKNLAQKSLKQSAQIRLMPYAHHYKTNQMRIELVDKLKKGTLPKKDIGIFDAKKTFPKLSYKQAGRFEYQLQSGFMNRNVVIGSTIVSHGKAKGVKFLDPSTINVKVSNPKYIKVGTNKFIQSGKVFSVTGKPKTPKDIDIVTSFHKMGSTPLKVQKATGGKVTADVHSYFFDRTHPYSRTPVNVYSSQKGYRLQFSTQGEQLGRGFEGVTNIFKPMDQLKGMEKVSYNLKAYFFEKGDFYRYNKDAPKFLTNAETLIKKGISDKTGRPLVASSQKSKWLSKATRVWGRDLTPHDVDIYKFKRIPTIFPAKKGVAVSSVSSGSPKVPVAPPQPFSMNPTRPSSKRTAFKSRPVSFSRTRSPSPSPSFSRSVSFSGSPSPSVSRSPSPSPSFSRSPSLSPSASPSPSPSPSLSLSPSASPSPSPSPSVSPSPSFSFSPSVYFMPLSALKISKPRLGASTMFKRKVKKQPKAVTPTARAMSFNLKGKTLKSSIKTGLGERYTMKPKKSKMKLGGFSI